MSIQHFKLLIILITGFVLFNFNVSYSLPAPCSQEKLLETSVYAIEGYVINVKCSEPYDSGECVPDPEDKSQSFKPELIEHCIATVKITKVLKADYNIEDKVKIPFLKRVQKCEGGRHVIPGSPIKEIRLNSKIRYYNTWSCPYSNWKEIEKPLNKQREVEERSYFESTIKDMENLPIGTLRGEIKLHTNKPFKEGKKRDLIPELIIISPVRKLDNRDPTRWDIGPKGRITIAYNDKYGEWAGKTETEVRDLATGLWNAVPPPSPFWKYWGPKIARIGHTALGFIPYVGQAMNIVETSQKLALLFGEEADNNEIWDLEDRFDIKEVLISSPELRYLDRFRVHLPLRFTEAGEYPLHLVIRANLIDRGADPRGGSYTAHVEIPIHTMIRVW